MTCRSTWHTSKARQLAIVLALIFAVTALGQDSVLIFNEIQFHPANVATQTEWVELRSLQAVDVDIGGWRIEGGIDYIFPSGTVMTGYGYIIVAAVPSQITGAYGPFTGQLDNGGESIRLVNRNGRVMDELDYDDEGDWPIAPDGSGCTLARLSASAAKGAKMWAASPIVGGTPGAVNSAVVASTLVFSEISGAGDAGFFIELQNKSAIAASTDGWSVLTSTGATIALPAQSLAPGGFASFSAGSLGFTPADGMKLFLFAPGGTECRDAREVTSRLRGLTNDGRWGHPDSATPSAENVVTVSDAIVINEIFYRGLSGSAEQWIELHNKSAVSVDVSGWKFSDGVSYGIPTGTTIAAGGFLVAAWNPAAFAALHPGVTALGPWSGSLSGKGETITLRDANDNVADQATYADGGRWSQWADGGGSSLELRDPRADNSKGEAWDASDESDQSTWQTVSYSGLATPSTSTDPPSTAHPIGYNEFVFGLLNSGEFLIDDISVKDASAGNVELIQNGSFENDTAGGAAAKWRVIGTQSGSVTTEAGGGNVLRVNATGATEHMHNHAETTLKNASSYVAINPSHTYAISFRAKWLHGSNRLHTRLWHNRLARQTLLTVPTTGGTPGVANSKRVANIGPTFEALAHTPVVPAAGQSATVTIKVADPDTVSSVQFFRSVNGAAFTSSAMTTTGDGIFTATVPLQAAGALVRFYVQATDALGEVSSFPAAGSASRAMIPWADGRAQLTLPTGAKPHNLRIVLPSADATQLYKAENLMSDAPIPCTVILDESVAYYNAAVRLKGSEHGRITDTRCSYTLEFAADELFLGVHDTVSLDRSRSGVGAGQLEILLKTLSNIAGGIYMSEDDLCRVISPVGTVPPGLFSGATLTGAAILSKTRLDKEFLDAQFENGGDGAMFKYERIYVLTDTIDPSTRSVTTITTSNVLTAVSENPKVPQSTTSPPGVLVTSLGANKESYRWYWLIQNARDADDYSGIMNVTNAVGQTNSTQFNTLVAQHINVGTWLRGAIPAVLFGVIDNYLGLATGTDMHNVLVYFPPGQKAVLMPWDQDYTSQTDATTSLATGGDVPKFVANPVWRRLYYGHMLDILNRSFTSATMTRWATHYTKFSTDNMTASLSYLNSRAQYAREVITGTNGRTPPIAPVAFTRTSAATMTVSTPFATVSGDGWINVAEIRLQGSTEPLAVTWTDDNSWTLQLPVNAGTNTYTLIAYDNNGTQLGTITVTITGTGGVFPAGPGNLVVSELHYNPPGSGDTTEFIELLNITGATLDLGGCHFDEENSQGISYAFPAGVQVVAGGRIIIARDRAAFLTAYPSASSQLAPNQFDPSALDNSGESIVLYAASGMEIFRFSYNDNIGSTDGNGRSLVRALSSNTPSGTTYAWRASTADGGNPGTTDAIAFTGNMFADADQDGLQALLEYVQGTSDAAPTAPQSTFTHDPFGRWLLTFPHVVNADDAAVTIESVTSLGGVWAPAAATLISSTPAGGNLVTETWQLLPPAGSTTYYVRIKMTLR